MRDTIRDDFAGKKESEDQYFPLPAVLKDCTRLNVRELPNPTSRVTGLLTSTDRIKIDNTYQNAMWVKVVEPKFGYASKKFIEVK